MLKKKSKEKFGKCKYFYCNGRLKNPSFQELNVGEFCFTIIGRPDIQGSKSNMTMNTWPPQSRYPCGNFSDTSCLKLQRSKKKKKTSKYQPMADSC